MSITECARCNFWNGMKCTDPEIWVDYSDAEVCRYQQGARKIVKTSVLPTTSDVLEAVFQSHRATLRHLRTTYTDQQILEFIQDNLITLVPTEIRPQCTNW